MHKTRERRSSFTPIFMASASSARWDAFAAECVDWMLTRAENGVLSRATTGEGRLLAIFDIFGDWVEGRDHEAASVVDAVLRLNDRHPVARIVLQQAPRIRTTVVDLGHQAGLVDVDEFAESWHILLRGTVMRASEGDTSAPARARGMGMDLIARHRPSPVVQAFAYDADSEFGWVEGYYDDEPPVVSSSVRSADPRGFDWFDAYGEVEDYFAPVAYTA